MRNPLKRLARRDAPKAPLRERLDAVKACLAAGKAKAGRIVAVNRIMLRPLPAPAPPVDRAALVNYASWLFMERRLVCLELYPHMGHRADTFVVDAQAANAFHYPLNGDWRDVPKPSARAVRILDMLGIDWRSDRKRDPDHNLTSLRDDGERPALPHDWPQVDARLLEALDNLDRLDAAQEAMHTAGRADREGDTVPGYEALEEARDAVLEALAKLKAESRTGLQAKARAILAKTVRDQGTSPGGVNAWDRIVQSLAGDLLNLSSRAMEPQADPIFAVIEEARRLEAECDAAEASTPRGQDVPEEVPAAVWRYVDGTLLKTVPRTAAGCKALAAFAPAFFDRWGTTLDDGRGAALFSLIARSPLL